MRFSPSDSINGVWSRTIKGHFDTRGSFLETFRNADPPAIGFEFVQDSFSFSQNNVLRGMHFQENQWQLITVIQGKIIDVCLDIRKDSDSFGKYCVFELEADGLNQILLSPGIAHGFCTLNDSNIIHYKSSEYYGDTPQHGINWQSDILKIIWPKNNWIVSHRDLAFAYFEDLF